jgi:hypothetical protein
MVSGRAADQQQRRERQQIGIDRPLQLGRRRVKVRPDRGQRDVGDRSVDEGEARREDARDEREPRILCRSAIRGGFSRRNGP